MLELEAISEQLVLATIPLLVQVIGWPNLDSSLNSCTIGDHAYIGANASIGKGATVESGAMVAAGAIVPPGAKVPSGQVWAGNPAKFLRDLTAVEKENLREQHHEYSKLAEIHSERSSDSSKTQRNPLGSTSTRLMSDIP